MSIIASLGVNLTAGVAGFAKGTKQAESLLGSLAKKATSVGSVLTGLGVGLSVAGIVSWVKSAADAADALGDLAEQTGVEIKALAGLGHAAKLNGSSLDDMGGALKKMNNSLGEAALGSGPASKTLERLGLNAKELVAMKPDQAFMKIADAIKGIQNPALKTVAVLDIFGKSGAGLIQTLNLGAEGLRLATAEAEKFGIAISAADEAKIDAMNDSFDRMKAAIAGAATQIAVALAPAMEKFVTGATVGISSITNSILAMQAVMENFGMVMRLELAKANRDFVENTQQIIEFLSKFNLPVLLMNAAGLQATSKIQGLLDPLLDQTQKKVNDLTQELDAKFDKFMQGSIPFEPAPASPKTATGGGLPGFAGMLGGLGTSIATALGLAENAAIDMAAATDRWISEMGPEGDKAWLEEMAGVPSEEKDRETNVMLDRSKEGFDQIASNIRAATEDRENKQIAETNRILKEIARSVKGGSDFQTVSLPA